MIQYTCFHLFKEVENGSLPSPSSNALPSSKVPITVDCTEILLHRKNMLLHSLNCLVPHFLLIYSGINLNKVFHILGR